MLQRPCPRDHPLVPHAHAPARGCPPGSRVEASSFECQTEAAAALCALLQKAAERTFLACKPDAVQRGLVGDIIARFEKRGYKLVGLKMVWPSEAMAKQVRRGLGAL